MSKPEATCGVATSNAARLRAAIAGDYHRLCRAVAPLVRRAYGPTRFDLLRDRVEEVVDEAVGRALARAGAYDPARAVFPWVMGFACRVLRERRRGDETARARQPSQADLAEAEWEQAMERFVVAHPAGADGTDLGRLHRAMMKLSETDRRRLALRFEDDLDGPALAQADGAPSAGAARVRLCRALKALRTAFDREPPADDDGDDRGAGQEEASR